MTGLSKLLLCDNWKLQKTNSLSSLKHTQHIQFFQLYFLNCGLNNMTVLGLETTDLF
jgi:hypothetical protein